MVEAQNDFVEAANKVERCIATPASSVCPPVLVLLSGLPGTGKSSLARRLQEQLPSALVQSDYVRKLLFKRPSYGPAESAMVHVTCHAVVARLLAKGFVVIMDATNLVESHRELYYRVAERAGAKLVIVRTIAPRAIVLERLDQRARSGAGQRELGVSIDDISDADASVYEKMRGSEEPIRRQHIVVDTSRDLDSAIRQIVRLARGE